MTHQAAIHSAPLQTRAADGGDRPLSDLIDLFDEGSMNNVLLRLDPDATVAYALRSEETTAFVLRSDEYPGGQLLVVSDAQLAKMASVTKLSTAQPCAYRLTA
ncbi:MAG: hypothetical protein WB810_14550 [Candidatus Cybelea sp.]